MSEQGDKVVRRVVGVSVMAVLVYAGFGLWADARSVWAVFGRLSLWVWAAALGLSCGNYALRFVKWQMYLRALDVRPEPALRTHQSALIFLSGMLMSVTPGKIGEVFKSYLLKQSHGVEVARTAPVVLAERLTDVIALLVLSGAGLFVFDYGRWVFGVCAVGVCVGLFVLGRERLMGRMVQWVGLKRPALGQRLEVAYDSMRALLRWRLLLSTSLLSVCSWGLEALAFMLLLSEVGGVMPDWSRASFLYAMSTLVGAVSFLPGGLGVTEAGLIGGIGALGLLQDSAQATAVTGAIRLTTLWFGVALGGVALLGFRRFVPSFASQTEDL